MFTKLNMGSKEVAIMAVGLLGAISILPFIFIRVFAQQYQIAMIDLFLFSGCLCVSTYVYKTKKTGYAGIVMTIFCAVGIGGLIFAYGQSMIYWVYPIMIAMYFMTNPLATIILNSVVIVTISPKLYDSFDFTQFLAVIITLVVTNIFVFIFSNMTSKQKKIMHKLAWFDGLTGIRNRRSLNKEFEDIKLSKNKISIIIIDIDYFKVINDTYGHLFGDDILIQVSNAIKSRIRSTDVIYRYGGEEFVVILPNTDIKKAEKVSDDLRAHIEKHEFDMAIKVTISLGVSTILNNEDPLSCFNRCDKALYEAKRTGRNKCCSS